VTVSSSQAGNPAAITKKKSFRDEWLFLIKRCGEKKKLKIRRCRFPACVTASSSQAGNPAAITKKKSFRDEWLFALYSI
jgi:hypothetical protein